MSQPEVEMRLAGLAYLAAATAPDPIVLPDAAPRWVARVVEIGVGHAQAVGLGPLEVVVDRADCAMRALLEGLGFVVAHGAPLGVVDAWLAADARPAVGILPVGYRLRCRPDASSRPHHLVARSGPGVKERLRQVSLYRPELAAARRLYLGAGFEVGKETVVLALAAAPVRS